MFITDLISYKGRNIYSHRKVVKMVVDLGCWLDIPTNEIEGFNKRLLDTLPSLGNHCCSLGYPGGFAERLEKGTYLAHVIEHCALEIQNLLGYDVSFGKARRIEDSDLYNVIFAYENEKVAIEVGKFTVTMIDALCNGHEVELKEQLAKIKEKADKNDLGPSTRAIVDAAIERGIPVTRIGDGSIIQLGYGRYQKRIEATITENTSCIAVDISCDKSITKYILWEMGLPVPDGFICSTIDEAIEAVNKLGYPVVIKPERGNQGKGVSVNLDCYDEITNAFKIAKQLDDNVIVEKYIPGRDYRVLVIGDRVVAVSQRVPAHVIGDGMNSIKMLVDMVNANQLRGEEHEKPLTKIKLDDISLALLKKQGYTLETVPDVGAIVYLKANGNLSTGGEAIDCTDNIHPLNCELAVRAARIVGLDIAGIDITCKDISTPIKEGEGAIIEVNAAPGIRMHLYPSKGKPRKVGDHIIDMLYPSGSRHSIPIISITGTNGKTTTTRMVSHILQVHGMNVGMTSTGGVFINDKCVMKGDTTGPSSARIILSDKSVDAAVLETARGGIIRSGLGYDLSDVGVITNISQDHLGIDGIKTLDDLLHVKSLVVEAVKSNGCAVLNADDPIVVQAADRLKSNIIYFSRQEDNIIIHKHLVEGGIAVFLRNGYITISTGDGLVQSLHVSQIPATYGGRLEYNIENSLAAVSVAFAMKIPINTIEKALSSFYTDEHQNLGRFNIYNIKDFRVVVDYGHNIAGYLSISQALKKMDASRLIGVIGAPGDRDNDSIKTIGKISGETFNEIIIKEDKHLRGRNKGEVAKLLEHGALRGGMQKSDIIIIHDEVEALNYAMTRAQPGDLIIIFYEELEPILETIKKFANKFIREDKFQSIITM